jgi:hypothetical protein
MKTSIADEKSNREQCQTTNQSNPGRRTPHGFSPTPSPKKTLLPTITTKAIWQKIKSALILSVFII